MTWTAPRTWVSGETVTAAIMNTHLRDNLKSIGDAWTAYTPVWTASTTNPVLNNGTMTGHYVEAGKMITFRIRVTIGSTTTFGTGASYFWTLPFSCTGTSDPVGRVILFDASVGTLFPNHAFTINATAVVSALENGNRTSPTGPIAWAVGDKINLLGTYEAT